LGCKARREKGLHFILRCRFPDNIFASKYFFNKSFTILRLSIAEAL
jgi:hypothetical protein